MAYNSGMKVAPIDFTWDYENFSSFYGGTNEAFLAVDCVQHVYTAILMDPKDKYCSITHGLWKKSHPVTGIKQDKAARQLRMSGHHWLKIKHPDIRHLKALQENLWNSANIRVLNEALGDSVNRTGGVPGNPVQLLSGAAWPVVDPNFTYEHQLVTQGVAAGEPCIVVVRSPGDHLDATLMDTDGNVSWTTAGYATSEHPPRMVTKKDVTKRWAKVTQPALIIRNADEKELKDLMHKFWAKENIKDVLMLTPDPATGVIPRLGKVELARDGNVGKSFDPFDL